MKNDYKDKFSKLYEDQIELFAHHVRRIGYEEMATMEFGSEKEALLHSVAVFVSSVRQTLAGVEIAIDEHDHAIRTLNEANMILGNTSEEQQ